MEKLTYPASPTNVPKELTRARASYKRQAWLALFGLTAFIAIYFALATCFGFIAYSSILAIQAGSDEYIIIAAISILLTVFMLKSLFTVRRSGDPGGVEVTPEDEPKLFEFLHKLADEIGAPKPYRVFITPEVNAAVFYDLSLFNLIFPSRKNLIIGLGLVNVLNLGELKAVLAHEFGHFAQNSMAVGRWVYIAQQIIGHMVATRDWLDSIVKFISRVDLRIAWLGWLIGLILWAIRSLMDTLFQLVVLAERALSREMEFNADLVAVSVTGSDALVHALHKLQAADEAWQSTLDLAAGQAHRGKRIDDLFNAQEEAIQSIAKIINDEHYGSVPEAKKADKSQHRVFADQMARAPQMWSTHPGNRDREDNAKRTYIAAEIDTNSSWLLFSDAKKLRQTISASFYQANRINEMEVLSAEDAVHQRYDTKALSPKYRGTYLSRRPMRNFSSVDELVSYSKIKSLGKDTIEGLYPDSVSATLEQARSLDAERHTLEALAAGTLKPSGGIIRHRGNELKKSDIPSALEELAVERRAIAETLKTHDADCRHAYLLAGKQVGQGWDHYILGLIKLWHCTEHLQAVVENENALLINTWQVITADGQIGYFEKRRMLKVCQQVGAKMHEVSQALYDLPLPPTLLETLGINDWQSECPFFNIEAANKSNWPDWCQAASEIMDNMSNAIGTVRSIGLEQLLLTEEKLDEMVKGELAVELAPEPGHCPSDYPTLSPGDEHVLQRKLDLWNRFQLADGFFPTTLRLLVSVGIVGGTIFFGFVGFQL